MRSAKTLGAAATLALAVAFSAQGQDRSPELVSALQLRPDQQAAYAAYLKATAPDPRRRGAAAPGGRAPARVDHAPALRLDACPGGGRPRRA